MSEQSAFGIVPFRTLLLALVALALAVPAAMADDVGEARAAIEKANVKFSQAFARGDAAALAALYTSDAMVFPPDSEVVRGSEAIGAFWKRSHDGGVTSVTLSTTDVGRSGDLAYEVGTVALTIQAKGASTTTTEKYLVVWKQQDDGSWKLHRDIWNSLPKR